MLVFRHQGQDFLHVVDEAHVEHAVGFVQNQHLHLTEVQHALLLQVQQTARCGDQNVHPFFELADLRVHAHAAKDDGGGEFQVFAVGADGFFNLCGQFARRCQHQYADADAAKAAFGALAHAQALQHGQGEGGGFAGAGLRATQQVTPSKHAGDGLRLYRSWGVVALFEYGFQNGRSQVQFFKFHEFYWRSVQSAWESARRSIKAAPVKGRRKAKLVKVPGCKDTMKNACLAELTWFSRVIRPQQGAGVVYNWSSQHVDYRITGQ